MGFRVKILLGIVGGIVFVGAALQTPLLEQARHTVWRVIVAGVGAATGVGPLESDDDYQQQLERLRAENVRLRAQEQDYQRLRSQLGSHSFASLRTIPALVSATPLDPFRTEVVLNQGTRDGVTLGAPVVTQGSVLVGFITDLSESTSVCRFLLHPTTSLPAEVSDIENARGLLRGHAYTAVVLSTVPRDVALAHGQPVVTTAQGDVPQGLLIGTVDQIRNEENEAYQEARLALPYDLENLRAVSILVAP